jgi:cell division protein FtsA
VLTGGAAKLSGLDEAAGKIFGVPGRLGEAPAWVTEELRDPGYSTALGLLYYGLHAQRERSAAGRRFGGGFLSNLKRIFVTS